MACENGYIEMYNFPRASHTQEITCQERRLALNYEIRDMEECVSSLNGQTNIQYIQDVMDVLTKIQESWKEHE